MGIYDDYANARLKAFESSKAPKMSAGEQRGRALPSGVQGGINAISQAPFGIGDEVYGALGGLGAIANNAYGAMGGNVKPVDVKGTYLQERDFIRGAQHAATEKNPTLAPVTTLMAGAPLALFNPLKFKELAQATTVAGKAGNFLKHTGQAAATGGLFGGVYGAGASEKDTVGGVTDDTMTGAGWGAGIGAGLNAGLAGGGALGKWLSIKALGNVKSKGVINQATGQAGAVDPISPLVDKTQQWIRDAGDAKISEAIIQTVGGRNKGLDPAYDKQMLTELNAYFRKKMPLASQADIDTAIAGTNWAKSRVLYPEGVPANVTTARNLAKMPNNTPLVSANGLKTNELRQLDAIALQSGRTSPVLADKQGRMAETSAKRFINNADEVLFSNNADLSVMTMAQKKAHLDYNKNIQALNAKATADAKPYYDILATTNVTIDDELRELIQRADSHLAKANEMAKLEGESFKDILAFVNPASGKTEIPIMQLERIKRSMNSALGKLKTEGDKELSRSIGIAKSALLDKLERSSPKTASGESVHGLANKLFAEPKQLAEQVEEGANIFKKNHMDIRDEKALLNAPELQAYEIGVFRALEEKMGTAAGRNFLTNLSRDRNASQALVAAIGKEKFGQLARMMKAEHRLKGLYAVNSGSQTGERAAAQAELGLDPLRDVSDAIGDFITKSPLKGTAKIAGVVKKATMPEPVRDYIGRRYLSEGQEAQEYLMTLGDLMKKIEASRSNRAIKSGTFGSLGYNNKPKDSK